MAIIPGVPGLEVSIVVDGKPLHEYVDEYEEEEEHVGDITKKVTRYVECQSGKAFGVQVKFRPGFKSVAEREVATAAVSIDGLPIDHLHYDRRFRNRRKDIFNHIFYGPAHIESGQGRYKPMLFTDLGLDGENMQVERALPIKHLGTISVKIQRGMKVARNANTLERSGLHRPSVSEKALKGSSVSHYVNLGEAQHVSEPTFAAVKLRGGAPFAKFDFKYRSRKSLQALLIIPRSPSPTALEDKDPDDLTLEEARELLRRQRARSPKNKLELKREHTTDADSDEDELSIVPAPKRSKVIETIDLTDD
ncbi:hypothetical protein AAFC00_003094 [Neodothiora populina]|uniref:DUF7918 domain-containing protein n=1 Tax=Neodothiora populina TaxID=2781224 RepID=A0ABR3P998_9PEZI